MSELRLSTLGHTWLLDLDGTIVKHNGYLIDGFDTLLEGALDFLSKIPEKDSIVLLTSRDEKYREATVRFLEENKIRFHKILFGLPYGERILLNDCKPSGLVMGYAVNKERDAGDFPVVTEDPGL